MRNQSESLIQLISYTQPQYIYIYSRKPPIPNLSLSLAKSMVASTSSTTTFKTHLHLITPPLSKPYSSHLPFKSHKFTSGLCHHHFCISCTLDSTGRLSGWIARTKTGRWRGCPDPIRWGGLVSMEGSTSRRP